MNYLIKVYDEDSESTTTVAGSGDIEAVKKSWKMKVGFMSVTLKLE